MSTYTQILYQIVFGSKDYTEFLNKENQGSLFGYIVGILMKRECHPYQIGGCGNHVHILTHVSTTITLAGLVRDIKRASHEMMVKGKRLFKLFPGWQAGYGAFTYNISMKPVLIHYIQNQEEHHRKISFKEEMTVLLKENKIPFKEEYLLV
ncbi:MAG: transposase [Bacteroidetes bacterium]|jgi:REP element-mobilizing transposase RayT|nr:transposase [Bacteroidota bacterium]